jgi:manganese/zinc/iron transport system substrate-binding protein
MRSSSVFLGLGLALLIACTDNKPRGKNDKPYVVATTGMVADLARHVGGEFVTVEALMGPGVDPHLYKATPSDLKKLRAADVILFNGKGLEGKMADVLGKLSRTKSVAAVTDSIREDELESTHPGHLDPHVWFDVALWSRCAAVVGETLAKADPAHAERYRENAASYQSELEGEFDTWVRSRIATIPVEQRVLITSHDAFRYFGRAYQMEVHGLQGISTASVAGVKDVENLVDLIVNRKIKAIFVETSVSPKALTAVQEHVRRRGHEVVIGGKLFSDAMGDTPETDHYTGMIRHNVETLVGALR